MKKNFLILLGLIISLNASLKGFSSRPLTYTTADDSTSEPLLAAYRTEVPAAASGGGAGGSGAAGSTDSRPAPWATDVEIRIVDSDNTLEKITKKDFQTSIELALFLEHANRLFFGVIKLISIKHSARPDDVIFLRDPISEVLSPGIILPLAADENTLNIVLWRLGSTLRFTHGLMTGIDTSKQEVTYSLPTHIEIKLTRWSETLAAQLLTTPLDAPFPEVIVGEGQSSCTPTELLDKRFSCPVVKTTISFVPFEGSNYTEPHSLSEYKRIETIRDLERLINQAAQTFPYRIAYIKMLFNGSFKGHAIIQAPALQVENGCLLHISHTTGDSLIKFYRALDHLKCSPTEIDIRVTEWDEESVISESFGRITKPRIVLNVLPDHRGLNPEDLPSAAAVAGAYSAAWGR